MKIRHRITYDKEETNEKFIQFLKEKNAKIESSKSHIGVAYVDEEEEYKDQLHEFYQIEGITPLIEVVYSKSDYKNAEWYYIRPKFRFEYPQPEEDFAYETKTY
ncbi:MAG: hypothetical protein ACRCWQ_03670, partial [Bacilli bacterium]